MNCTNELTINAAKGILHSEERFEARELELELEINRHALMIIKGI